ncbi:nitrate reductase [Alteromonas oceanisediminis]|uniref:nitrate reductase n=1 Tax=Alteromonas oceanisediminis TaxID=2836180 RepID=UPI001BDB576D|nr:nitrate reductase [Alteromonas oceanisediminis]MBT0586030.1 nitrate reductase [Alteromonas oceanisediminis]
MLHSAQRVSTTCPYCGVGCGVEVACSTKGSTASISDLVGQRNHPANFGQLCVKGSHLRDTLGTEGRLAEPSIGGKTVTWDSALLAVADGFLDAIQQYGPDSVAFYVSGQLLTEDYYVANKLMKGFIGSANIDTNSRLCMSSAVAAYQRAFGADAVPCNYEDLENTDYLVLTGSNAAWTHPVLFQRIERAKQHNPNMQIVVIDPRHTASCEIADLHLPLRPGSDVALFSGLLNYLTEHDHLDREYITHYTQGFDSARSAAVEFTPAKVAEVCDLDLSTVLAFYAGFARSDTSVTFYSMGVNQSSAGVDKATAIIQCHLATGKIGKVGSGPFSITGQPNAMGGREVGGLSNMLAAHMNIDNAHHRDIVQTFWQSPTIATKPGYKAVDLFSALKSGKIKALWIMATNPVVSMPNRNEIEQALGQCPLVVVSDIVKSNDTLHYADIVLPATGWSEKDGTVTNSERRISRQRGIMPAYGNARHDWAIICDVARRMGFRHGFNFKSPAHIFAEHARLSAYQNQGSRDFDISGLSGLTEREYEQLKPIQWPVTSDAPNGTARMFTNGQFFTPSGKAQFTALQFTLPEQQTSQRFPFVLNTGRLRDQWHSMTRTGLSSALNQHTAEPFVAMHPADAEQQSLSNGGLAVLASSVAVQQQPVVMRVQLSTSQRRGELFAPIHWSATNTSAGSVARLFSSARDAVSGQPELKHAAVNIRPLNPKSTAHLFSKSELPSTFLASMAYWCSVPFEGGLQYQLASHVTLSEFVESLQPLLEADVDILQRFSQHQYTIATLCDQRCTLVARISHSEEQHPSLSGEWMQMLFQQAQLESDDIAELLRAETPSHISLGQVICTCFSVREQSIIDAIDSGHQSVEALGAQLQCGTNCGSCKTELSRLIKERNPHAARSAQSIPVRTLSPTSEASEL